ncbi:unnamed protein product [Rotaria sp. Silwood2]|nr:unnamed protein product [Rotaria sp. Silwood2]CAF2463161.1 unnamed protein product [Rotaria sp. Silwood2]CAF2699268.1 unnamed protein product [Rotaria sp. Silwood2]CAF2853099.1 unnamed protein product [Rotaria sp. Silwood2]CAF3916656.1 unnamed protein product [Rotaria sp. Silwood2]
MMAETTSVSGTVTRTSKPLDTVHPHYFNSFQNYCCGPKAKSASSPSNKEFLPIPEKYKQRADQILSFINQILIEHLSELTQLTSVLPHKYFEQDSMTDCQRYLIDRTMLKVMNETRVINWVPSLKKLYPIRTSGNGNCLLHAVLIAMVGVHDFNLYLRDRLLQFMDKNKAVLKGSWKTERLKTDKMYGIQSEDSKLDSEWEELCDLVRYESSDDGQTASNLQFLEGVHIFSISNMLARPIIILSEDVVRNKHGEAISYNDLFGIYLPILSKPKDCVPVPIVLAYDQSHFCPLQTDDRITGLKSDNFLPLYQSIEHTRNQTLLPIRFLGNDNNIEQNTKLLHSYLRIKKLSCYPDTNGTPLPILCAELGNRILPEKEDFFLLYYHYVMDCFDMQKKKIQEEEDKQRLEQEYYIPNQSSYETNQRSLMKRDNSSTPPPPYSSISTRLNDNKNIPSYERRPSYDLAVTNGATNVLSNDGNRSINQYSEQQQQQQQQHQQQLQKLQNHIQIPQRSQVTHDNHYNNGKQLLYKSEWESNDDVSIPNGKNISNSNNNPRGSDSKLKQEQQYQRFIQIPVNVIKSDSSSMNLIDFEQKTDKIRPCIVCKHYFNDLLSTGLCSECDYNRKHPLPRHVTTLRSSPMNIYSTSYKNSDFISPLQSSPKIKGPHKIFCQQCRSLNILNGIKHGTNHSCSICKTILNVPR